jgi:hypothetical protein
MTTDQVNEILKKDSGAIRIALESLEELKNNPKAIDLITHQMKRAREFTRDRAGIEAVNAIAGVYMLLSCFGVIDGTDMIQAPSVLAVSIAEDEKVVDEMIVTGPTTETIRTYEKLEYTAQTTLATAIADGRSKDHIMSELNGTLHGFLMALNYEPLMSSGKAKIALAKMYTNAWLVVNIHKITDRSKLNMVKWVIV